MQLPSLLRAILLSVLLVCATWAQQKFDHKALSQVLQDYVQGGKVDYAGLKKNRLAELRGYIHSLASVHPEQWSHSDQVAFWLNAYNAIVIQQICEGKAPSSASARGQFFRQATFLVAGEERSLDDMEHRALRPLAKDPRIHFVLVCGANSCPPLRASAFAGQADLEKALEEAATRYINDPANVKIDRTQRKITLNPIFDWYQEDFGEVVPFLARYRPAQERAELLQGEWQLEFRDYDWSVNQTH